MDEIKVRRVAGRGHHLHRGQPDAQAIIWQGRINRDVPVAMGDAADVVTHQAADQIVADHMAGGIAGGDTSCHPAHQAADADAAADIAQGVAVGNGAVTATHQATCGRAAADRDIGIAAVDDTSSPVRANQPTGTRLIDFAASHRPGGVVAEHRARVATHQSAHVVQTGDRDIDQAHIGNGCRRPRHTE